MSNYSSLKATINANVKANGNQEITGPVMNSVLNAMVDSLGAGYQYMGKAVPSTNPGTPDAKVFYLASDPGTYTNFNGLVVADGEVAFLKWDSAWSKEVTGVATAAQVTQLGQKVDEFAQGKFYGYFSNAEDLPTGKMETGFAYVGEQPPFAIYNYDGGTWTDSGLTVNDIPVGNGEDIDFNAGGLLQFANRAYDAQDPNGMGYVILRKNKTFAEQVTLANTIYEIRYDFDLNGGSVTIPTGCTLRFNGGAISNGTIVYDSTEIQGEPLISCTCTGALRNSVVTPQMYGAKGDGVTDDFNALQSAISYNDTMFVPAGTYIISNKILLTKNKTVYGVGRESKIHNNVVTGFEKYCFEAGSIEVGTHAQSFLRITSQSCTISSDRWSVLVADTSDFSVGDIVYICVDETYTTKNPKNSWSAKVVSIEENTSLGLDAYVDQDAVATGSCLIRNMKHLPTGSISENICIHDLSLANIVDSGSGMYVIGFSAYNADFYNLWMHGNTLIGANYAINVTIDNITGEFDGGFCDIPEISQFAVLRNCHAKRFGSRLNTIGITFLQGYKVTIADNVIDFGNLGKVGVGNHLYPNIHDNEFLNVKASDAPIDLSTFGNNIFKDNRVTSKQTSAIVTLGGATTGNIFTGNYIDNPGFNRWLYNFNSVDYQQNTIKDNITSQNSTSDAYFMDMVNTRPDSEIHQIFGNSNITIAAGATRTIFDTAARTMGRPRLAKITIVTSEADYKAEIYNASSHTTLTVTGCVKLELYVFAIGSYIRYVKHMSASTASGVITYNLGQMTKIILTNNGQDAMTLHAAYIDIIR